MLVVSDVHGAMGPLRRLVETGENVVILGDLVNLTDYRDGAGAVADVLGIEFARAVAEARATGDYAGMRSLFREQGGARADELREEIGRALDRQYEEVAEALRGGRGLVIHGNVDRPKKLIEILPEGFQYVHGKALEVEGMLLGFAGGGVSTPLGADGEVSDEEMTAILEDMGPVEVLCTHVPPAVSPLRHDVITGREERGSEPIRDYILRHQPRLHLYGDIHQAQATTWRLGKTRCVNAGFFRATGRFLRLEAATVQVARVG